MNNLNRIDSNRATHRIMRVLQVLVFAMPVFLATNVHAVEHPFCLAKEAIPALKDLLANGDVSVRLDSAWVLLKIGAFRKEAVAAFAEALEPKNTKVCLPAMNKAERLGTAGAALLPVVKKLADSEDRGVRDRATAVAAALRGRSP